MLSQTVAKILEQSFTDHETNTADMAYQFHSVTKRTEEIHYLRQVPRGQTYHLCLVPSSPNDYYGTAEDSG
jgi:hypothetical protein